MGRLIQPMKNSQLIEQLQQVLPVVASEAKLNAAVKENLAPITNGITTISAALEKAHSEAIAHEKLNAELIEKRTKLRALHGAVACVELTAYNAQGEAEQVHGWFKKPKMDVLDAVNSLDEKTELTRAIKVLFADCWIEGDNRIKEVEYLKIDAFKALQPFLKQTVARIKKL